MYVLSFVCFVRVSVSVVCFELCVCVCLFV